MFDRLKKILEKADADYADLRYEVKKSTGISFQGKDLTHIGSNSTDGYVLRVLKDGGMSSVVFTQESDADKAVHTAVENAGLISKNVKKPVRLAKTEIVNDTFLPPLKENPREIPMPEKLELVRKYNHIPLGHEKIVTTTLHYGELLREKYFVNTEGTQIREDLLTTRLAGAIISKEGNLIQNVSVTAGGSDGFSTVRNQEDNFEDKTKIALDLLKAQPFEGGVRNCVLNPLLAGVFTHEAFGHFSEADIIEDLPAMREKMKLGSKLGNDILNIKDDATLPDQLGFYKYDDEGVKVRPTQLMREGVLTGRMHSRRTASEFGEPLSGHCVAEDYRYPPIIRMGTIFIQPGKLGLEELLRELDNGLYLVDTRGGETSGESFTFGAQYGYLVKGGKIREMIRDINISGNLYQTLKNIVGVGNDFKLSVVGGCGKGQTNIRSCFGAPHILVKNLVIGGA
jgi:TldD protein